MIVATAQDGLPELGYWMCAGAFLAIAGLAAFSRLEGFRKWMTVSACLATSGWAVAMAFPQIVDVVPPGARVAELVRNSAWVMLLASMLNGRKSLRRWLAAVPPLLCATASAGVAILVILAIELAGFGAAIAWATVYLNILLSVGGLFLIENLYRNSEPDKKWGIKGICLGLSVIFLFGLVFHADAALMRVPDPNFVRAQGFVDTLAAALLLLAVLRGRAWRADFKVSRHFVFHSTVLVGIGVYLVAMAAMATVLQWFGVWSALQMTFLVAGSLVLIVVVSSVSFRSAIRIFINKHFFSYKYDYRDVWLEFIRQVSRGDDGHDIQTRVLHAVADIFESPAGALWMRRPEDDLFYPMANWNFGDRLPAVAVDSALPRYLDATGGIVDVQHCARTPNRHRDLEMPAWLREHPRAWLLVPLPHNGELRGFLILGTPRVRVEIGWEAIDLLKTIGEQAASYLAEEAASRALQDARRLEEFNRCLAFVMHDIKSLVAQMSLLLENAERHGSDAAFQADALATVAASVARMRAILEDLRAKSAPSLPLKGPVDIASVVQAVGERWRRSIPSLRVSGVDRAVMVQAKEEILTSIFDHLIQNAFEATGANGRVELVLRHRFREGMLEVHDDGPGMDAEFVRDELFQPLNSRKPYGFGLGAFQVRQLVRGLGGRLEVDSVPGVGTTMRVRLPTVDVPFMQRIESE